MSCKLWPIDATLRRIDRLEVTTTLMGRERPKTIDIVRNDLKALS